MNKLFIISTLSLIFYLHSDAQNRRNNDMDDDVYNQPNYGNWNNQQGGNNWNQSNNPYNDPNYYPSYGNGYGNCAPPPPPPPPCRRPVVVVPPSYCAPVVIAPNPYPYYRPYRAPYRHYGYGYGRGRGHWRRW